MAKGRTCPRCRETKSRVLYYYGGGGWCKSCTLAYRKERRILARQVREARRPPKQIAPLGEKHCSRCDQTKAIELFYAGSGWCKDCGKAYQKEKRRKLREGRE